MTWRREPRNMPHPKIAIVIATLKAKQNPATVIVMSAYGSVDLALGKMRGGEVETSWAGASQIDTEAAVAAVPVAKAAEAAVAATPSARKLAHELGGELKDDQRSVMTSQTIEHYRQRIVEFERRALTQKR